MENKKVMKELCALGKMSGKNGFFMAEKYKSVATEIASIIKILKTEKTVTLRQLREAQRMKKNVRNGKRKGHMMPIKEAEYPEWTMSLNEAVENSYGGGPSKVLRSTSFIGDSVDATIYDNVKKSTRTRKRNPINYRDSSDEEPLTIKKAKSSVTNDDVFKKPCTTVAKGVMSNARSLRSLAKVTLGNIAVQPNVTPERNNTLDKEVKPDSVKKMVAAFEMIGSMSKSGTGNFQIGAETSPDKKKSKSKNTISGESIIYDSDTNGSDELPSNSRSQIQSKGNEIQSVRNTMERRTTRRRGKESEAGNGKTYTANSTTAVCAENFDKQSSDINRLSANKNSESNKKDLNETLTKQLSNCKIKNTSDEDGIEEDRKRDNSVERNNCEIIIQENNAEPFRKYATRTKPVAKPKFFNKKEVLPDVSTTVVTSSMVVDEKINANSIPETQQISVENKNILKSAMEQRRSSPRTRSSTLGTNLKSNDLISEDPYSKHNLPQVCGMSSNQGSLTSIQETDEIDLNATHVVKASTRTKPIYNSKFFAVKKNTSDVVLIGPDTATSIDMQVDEVDKERKDEEPAKKKRTKRKKEMRVSEHPEVVEEVMVGRITRTKSKMTKQDPAKQNLAALAKKSLNKAKKLSTASQWSRISSDSSKENRMVENKYDITTSSKKKLGLQVGKSANTVLMDIRPPHIIVNKELSSSKYDKLKTNLLSSGNKFNSAGKLVGCGRINTEVTTFLKTAEEKMDSDVEIKMKLRLEKEEEAIKKKNLAIKEKQKLLKLKNDQKLKLAMSKREKLEKEKQEKNIQLEKEKEEKIKQALNEREKVKEEELLRKKMLLQQKIAENEERRRQEEETRLAKIKEQEEEEKRLAIEKQKEQERVEKRWKEYAKLQLQEKKRNQQEAENKMKFEKKLEMQKYKHIKKEVKHSTPKRINENYKARDENDYGLEDENSEDENGDSPPRISRAKPLWARGENLNLLVAWTSSIGLQSIFEYMPMEKKKPDELKMFNMTPSKRIRRNSSAIWDTPNTSFN